MVFKNVFVKILLLFVMNDLLFCFENMCIVFDIMKVVGKDVEILEIEGGWGYFDGIFLIVLKV